MLRVQLLLLSVCGVMSIGFFDMPALAAEETPEADRIYLEEPPATPEPREVRRNIITERFEDKTVRAERQVLLLSDNTRVSDGTYVEYYASGEKFCEGKFSKGAHDGEWTYWHDNGQVAKKITFDKGKADGSWKVYSADGTLIAERGYSKGMRSGKWATYREDGTTPMMIIDKYVDGAINGQRQTFFENGQLRQTAKFQDGKLHGDLTQWDEAGRKIAEATFKEGELDGKVRRWTVEGEVAIESPAESVPVVSGDEKEPEVDLTQIPEESPEE